MKTLTYIVVALVYSDYDEHPVTTMVQAVALMAFEVYQLWQGWEMLRRINQMY